MKTNISKNETTITIELAGHLDFESTQPFRDSLNSLVKDSKNCTIIFDLRELSFVGSSGITAFIQALRDFNGRAVQKPRYINVKSEFKKLITAFDSTNSFQFGEGQFGEGQFGEDGIFDSERRSIRSLDN